MVATEDLTAYNEVRFGGRSLCFDATIFIQPAQSIPEIGTALMIAGGTAETGPYLVTGMSRPATDDDVEQFMFAMHELDRDLPAGDGQLVTFRVIVNTDEDIALPTVRIAKAIKSRGIDGVVTAGTVPDEVAVDVWREAQARAARIREAGQS
jgi:hypothetical protein